MTELIFLVQEELEGGYTAKALGESIVTEGDTIEELKQNIKEAVELHYELTDKEIPRLVRLHIVKDEVITL
jgi:predicted RNase H-like HicB family nuclease